MVLRMLAYPVFANYSAYSNTSQLDHYLIISNYIIVKFLFRSKCLDCHGYLVLIFFPALFNPKLPGFVRQRNLLVPVLKFYSLCFVFGLEFCDHFLVYLSGLFELAFPRVADSFLHHEKLILVQSFLPFLL